MKLLKLLPLALFLGVISITFHQNRILANVSMAAIIKTKTPSGLVNIRANPGEQYPIVATVPNGFAIRVCTQCAPSEDEFKDKDGHWWTLVDWNNHESSGWVRSDYVFVIPRNPDNGFIEYLSDGNYTVCSQDVVTCFFFRKIGNQIIGSYYFPGTESVICVSGKISNNIIRGEAQGYSVYKKPVEYLTYWDDEKVFNPLRVGQESVIQVVENQATGNEWSYYHKAELNLNDFLLADNEGAGGKNVSSSPPPVSCHPPN